MENAQLQLMRKRVLALDEEFNPSTAGPTSTTADLHT